MSKRSDVEFRRSSYCGTGACIEVGFRPDGRVAVRDSARPSLPHLTVAPAAWERFQEAVRAGEFTP